MPEAVGAALFPRIAAWDAGPTEAASAAVAVPLLVVQRTAVGPGRVRVPLGLGVRSPWLDLVRRAAPAAEVAVVGGSGGLVMADRPEAVNRLVEDFVARLPRPGRAGRGVACPRPVRPSATPPRVRGPVPHHFAEKLG